MAPTIYTDRKGRDHEIGAMAYTYLKNAAGKLEINGNDPTMLAALQAEIERRDAAYAEQQAAEGQGED